MQIFNNTISCAPSRPKQKLLGEPRATHGDSQFIGAQASMALKTVSPGRDLKKLAMSYGSYGDAKMIWRDIWKRSTPLMSLFEFQC
jgi:hypothetical protein